MLGPPEDSSESTDHLARHYYYPRLRVRYKLEKKVVVGLGVYAPKKAVDASPGP